MLACILASIRAHDLLYGRPYRKRENSNCYVNTYSLSRQSSVVIETDVSLVFRDCIHYAVMRLLYYVGISFVWISIDEIRAFALLPDGLHVRRAMHLSSIFYTRKLADFHCAQLEFKRFVMYHVHHSRYVNVDSDSILWSFCCRRIYYRNHITNLLSKFCFYFTHVNEGTSARTAEY